MYGLSHKATCIELSLMKFPEYSRSVISTRHIHFHSLNGHVTQHQNRKCIQCLIFNPSHVKHLSYFMIIWTITRIHIAVEQNEQYVFVPQILYANEGECRKEADMESVSQGDKANCLSHKGHEFIPTLYHFPTTCEACSKPLWNMFKPPPALECRRCHVKCHKDHLDKKEDVIAPCKGETLADVGYITTYPLGISFLYSTFCMNVM